MGNLTVSTTSKNKCTFDSVIPFLENLSHRNTDKKKKNTQREGNVYKRKKSGNNLNVHK